MYESTHMAQHSIICTMLQKYFFNKYDGFWPTGLLDVWTWPLGNWMLSIVIGFLAVLIDLYNFIHSIIWEIYNRLKCRWLIYIKVTLHYYYFIFLLLFCLSSASHPLLAIRQWHTTGEKRPINLTRAPFPFALHYADRFMTLYLGNNMGVMRHKLDIGVSLQQVIFVFALYLDIIWSLTRMGYSIPICYLICLL